MGGWRREHRHIKKHAECNHKRVFWDATGKVGICVDCGVTVKRRQPRGKSS